MPNDSDTYECKLFSYSAEETVDFWVFEKSSVDEAERNNRTTYSDGTIIPFEEFNKEWTQFKSLLNDNRELWFMRQGLTSCYFITENDKGIYSFQLDSGKIKRK